MEHEASAFNDRRYMAVWECAVDAMVFLDHEGVLDCNEAGLRLFAVAERETLLGRPLYDFAPARQPHGVASRDLIGAQVEAALHHGQSRFECQLRANDGALFVVDIYLHRIPIGGGHIAHAILRDVTARWESERRLRDLKDAMEASLHQLTYFDSVTGLPNRAQFHEKAHLALADAGAGKRPLSIASVAVNELSHINNSLGHDAGDNVLKELASRLKAAVRESDIVARVSGNVFGVLFDGCAEESAGRAARALLAATAPPIRLGEHEIHVGVAIGLSIFARDGHDLWTLMQNAETAMYRAKATEENSYQFFSGDMSAVALERLVLESNLRRALEHDEFILYYQPQVDARSGRIVGVEALIRWRHPELGMVAPDRFIPLAEQSGLIVPIGDWVLYEACRQARAWQLAGLPAMDMCVNLSPRQFHKPDLLQKLEAVLAATGLAPERLVVELTEGALMDHTEDTLRTLAQLCALGVRLAVDDFGTGYSSLAYLKRFPLHKLKVDRSFVHGLGGEGSDDVVIARAIVDLGRNLRLDIIAEGIETAGELAALRSYGCDIMQGFYYSRPLPANEIEALLRSAIAC